MMTAASGKHSPHPDDEKSIYWISFRKR